MYIEHNESGSTMRKWQNDNGNNSNDNKNRMIIFTSGNSNKNSAPKLTTKPQQQQHDKYQRQYSRAVPYNNWPAAVEAALALSSAAAAFALADSAALSAKVLAASPSWTWARGHHTDPIRPNPITSNHIHSILSNQTHSNPFNQSDPSKSNHTHSFKYI